MRGGGSEAPPPTLERPPRAEFGDFSTNVAMLLAPALKAPPREIAERVGDGLGTGLGEELERAEVAGPGFLNLFLSDAWFRHALAGLREQGDRFGAGVVPPAERERILVEFVSANPTGPLTAASGRHAAYGDSLARVLELGGHEVEREYYVNDYGTQIELFGRSIAAAHARGAGARGRLPGRLRRRAGRAAARRGTRPFRPRVAHPPRARADARARCAPRSSASACGSTASSRSARCTTPAASRQAIALLEDGGSRLHLRGRDLAAHDGVRRRQGSGAAPLVGRVHLLRARTSPTTLTSASAVTTG